MAENINKKADKEPQEIRKHTNSTRVAFLPFLYLFGLFLFIVVYFWSEVGKGVEIEWAELLLSSVVFLIIAGFGFMVVSSFTIYRLIKDRSFFLALQRHWPLLFAILYFFIPNLPGPVDEFVVSILMGSLATYLGIRPKEKSLK